MDPLEPEATDHAITHTDRGSDALIHHEILQIGVLMLIAIVSFLVTRAVAANNREQTFRDAEAWYARGQQLMAEGRVGDAITSLRRAAVRNRYERKYALALARALSQKGDSEAARAALLTLREASPEDTEINLALARLAAGRQDVTEALRFYHNTLYAPWPADAARQRREVRFELIDFLLRHEQRGRALSELLTAAADLPDDAAAHVRVGRLFARAGDARHALDQYERALHLAPADRVALAGAGIGAFSLGEFQLARGYLARAPDDIDDVTRTREVVDLVLSIDPLARRVGSVERRRRVAASLDYVDQRLTACIAAGRSTGEPQTAATLAQEAATLREQLKASTPLEQDAIEEGVDLFGRIEQYVSQTCPPPTARDQALTLIARMHAMVSR
jgi:tetratricopeptide (TPR) repeat protein